MVPPVTDAWQGRTDVFCFCIRRLCFGSEACVDWGRGGRRGGDIDEGFVRVSRYEFTWAAGNFKSADKMSPW